MRNYLVRSRIKFNIDDNVKFNVRLITKFDYYMKEKNNDIDVIYIHNFCGEDFSEIRTQIGVINELISSYETPVGQLPNSNIVSHSLWKRMWAVFGHGLMGNVILTIWIIAITLLLFRGT